MNMYQDTWESRSSVRSRPRKIIDFTREGDFFPADKQSLLLVPEIASLGESVRKEILVQSFYKYLNDIVHLEMQWIYMACHHIMDKKLVVQYSDAIKLNACTIIIDEYYHMYIAYDMIFQLRGFFNNFMQLDYLESDANNAIITIKNLLEEKYHDMFEIIAVCIFETTLVRELVEYFDSKNIHPSIRYYVKDHMNDESRHYGFFCNLLRDTWANLPEDFKKNIGSNLAYFVQLYLGIHSEKAYNLQLLTHLWKDELKAKNSIDKLYYGFELSSEMPIVKNVLNVLRETRILDSEDVRQGFKAYHLHI
ncbi:MAG: hypothetical protein CK424_07295 [Legionella sp.]|nr:MAG: hypothetical protein CK424_07295 [Legionella sp.]